MGLSRLVVENLRCIERAELEFRRDRTFLVGPNGAGKTSLLESVYLLGRGRSFRTRHTRGLIRLGQFQFSVFGEVLETAVSGTERLGVAFQAGKLEARINGETASSVVELAERFPVHVLDPKLHQLIESGPSDRRRFVDGGVFHVEHSYLAHWRDYRRALGQRNAALKAGLYSQLKSWTEPLIEAGEAVDKLRREYIAGLSRQLAAISERLLDSPVGLVYAAGWRADASLAQALERSGERERQLCITQVGPHRADIELSFAGGAVKDIASRGQQKLIAAALVLAQVAEFERVSGRRGTMLIDDPAAELDDSALQRLLAEMERLQAQKVITGLRLEALGPTDDDAVFHVEQGKVNPVVY